MPGNTTVGAVTMLDTSGSIGSAITMVKIDAKAFIRSARPADQIAVVSFESTAKILYSNSGKMAVVDQNLTQSKAAADAINPLISSGGTDMGDAITYANGLIASSTADANAFIMISDGWWNVGPNPNGILGSQPPFYVAGWGAGFSPSKFDQMKAKNPNNKVIATPDAYQMMQLFNEIRGFSPDVDLPANELNEFNGTDYVLTKATIQEKSDEAQFSVAWTDPKYQYTSGPPGPTSINVILYPPGSSTPYPNPPQVVGEGYVIFNILGSVQKGDWHILVQFDVSSKIHGVSACLEFDTTANMDYDVPLTIKAGDPIQFTATITEDGDKVSGFQVEAHISRPTISPAKALKKYAKDLEKIEPDQGDLENGMPEDLAKLKALRESRLPDEDIMPSRKSLKFLSENENGDYDGTIQDTKEAGIYVVQLKTRGTNQKTGSTFARTRIFSVFVTED